MTTVRELKEQLEKLDDNLPLYIRDRGFNHNLGDCKWAGVSLYYTVGVVPK